MKKFKFTIQGNKYDVEILKIEDNVAHIEVNGSRYDVEIEKTVQASKTPVLKRAHIEPSTESDKSIAKTSPPHEKKGSGIVKSPLPGTVISVQVKEGDTVKVGDRLLILEAMKMENNINSDKEGRVVSVKVKPGDSVLEGGILIEIGD